ncbi:MULTISPECIES: DMT family transporter [Paenibacillus]|uniref:Transporter n=1 Tax=Paenibacillus azoreducens TaxID=116718 RepID=A0A919Y7W0_9BACL|nr:MULTISPECIES: DMT family transporter [Paenibacillus]MBE9915976.1 DMT family transporter [Paenibacillus donghaensis]GIO46581.1 transporter [Paenibacillus azoreducens]
MKAETWFRHPAGILISSAGATLLWGSALPVIKISYEHFQIDSSNVFGEWVFAGYRFALAGLMLIALALLMGQTRRTDRIPLSLPRVMRLGFIQTFMQYLVLYAGLSFSSGIEGSILVGSTSLFQILSARWMDKTERLNPAKWFGLLLGFLGILVMGFAQQGVQFHFGFGAVLLLASAAFGGFGNVLFRKESTNESVIALTGKQMFAGGLGLLLVGAVRSGLAPFHFDTKGWLLLAYLSLLSAAGFALWNTIMKYNAVGKVSLYLFLIPVFGVLLSAVLLDERVSAWIGLSLALVVTGIIIVNRSGQTSRKKAMTENGVPEKGVT